MLITYPNILKHQLRPHIHVRHIHFASTFRVLILYLSFLSMFVLHTQGKEIQMFAITEYPTTDYQRH
jgi:hypothetical protein